MGGGDSSGALVGLITAGAGAIELHGAGLLQAGESRGLRWLIGSQLFLLVAIMGYCALRLQQVELPPIPEEMQPLVETSAQRMSVAATPPSGLRPFGARFSPDSRPAESGLWMFKRRLRIVFGTAAAGRSPDLDAAIVPALAHTHPRRASGVI